MSGRAASSEHLLAGVFPKPRVFRVCYETQSSLWDFHFFSHFPSAESAGLFSFAPPGLGCLLVRSATLTGT